MDGDLLVRWFGRQFRLKNVACGLQKHLKVNLGQRLVIICIGFWFTTLRLDEWLRIANTTLTLVFVIG